MKIKITSAIVFLCGILALIVKDFTPTPLVKIYVYGYRTGMNGGIDPDTYNFAMQRFMSAWSRCFMPLGGALILTALFCFIFTKTVNKFCSLPTSAISVALSAVGGLGLFCAFVWFCIAAFGEADKYPIEYPTSIILGMLCFFVFIALIALYLAKRRERWSLKGFVIDILTSIIYLPSVFCACDIVYMLIA